MKQVAISILLVMSSTLLAGGVGGSDGGPTTAQWKVNIPAGVTPDWPIIHVNSGRNLSLNHFCIKDDQTLRTLRKYGQLGVRYNRNNLIKFGTFNKQYQEADRYYDEQGCYSASDPKCDLVNTYINQTVKLPLYYGKPSMNRDGIQSMRDFVVGSRIKSTIEVKIPHCQKGQ